MVLAAGVVITASAIIETQPWVENDSPRYVILGMSLLSSILAAYASFMNPIQRWKQLRGAALSMTSHIWQVFVCVLQAFDLWNY